MAYIESRSFPIKFRYKIRGLHSVSNRQGCEAILGVWEDKHKACVLYEYADRNFAHGWTAPIRGAYFYWYVGSLFDYKDRERFGAAIGAVRVENDEEYPEHPMMIPCEDAPSIFYEEVDIKKKEPYPVFYDRIKNMALKAAGDVLRGRDSDYPLIYYDRRGDISMKAKDTRDDVGRMPCHGCIPCSPDLHKPAPFRIKR